MTSGELLWILAACAYAIYQQTRRHEVVGSTRFKTAIVYAVIGLVVGGYNLPPNAASWAFLLVSILLSLAVGLLRGRTTRVWAEGGRVYTQGTSLTIGLFVGLVVAKFALGTLAYFLDVSDDGGVGEVLLMIAVMIAVQAEIVWRRAEPLGAPDDSATAARLPPG